MLARLPGTRETCEALRGVDTSRLLQDQVALLQQNLPSAEEAKKLREAERLYTLDESSAWDHAEEFVLALMAVPQIELRLQVWDFESSFQENVRRLSEAQTCLLEGCRRMVSCAGIRRLLGLVLAVGNFLNGGTPRGRADGFSIEALAQIGHVKTSKGDGPQTLVDFVAQEMARAHPGELEELFSPDGSAQVLRRAARPVHAEVLEELRGMRTALAQMLLALSSDESRQDVALAPHREALAMADWELCVLQDRFAELDCVYSRTCAWLHVAQAGHGRKTPDELFGACDSFLTSVGRARAAALERRGAEERRRLFRSNSLGRCSALDRRSPRGDAELPSARGSSHDAFCTPRRASFATPRRCLSAIRAAQARAAAPLAAGGGWAEEPSRAAALEVGECDRGQHSQEVC